MDFFWRLVGLEGVGAGVGVVKRDLGNAGRGAWIGGFEAVFLSLGGWRVEGFLWGFDEGVGLALGQ